MDFADLEKQLEAMPNKEEQPPNNSASNSEFTDVTPDTQPPKMGRLHEVAFIIVICLAQISAQCGVFQALAPIYIIGDHFGIRDGGQLSWYIASFSLTFGTFILPAGRLGDMYGHKRIFLIGTIWYALWSLVAGFSAFKNGLQGSILFSLARGFQGIGPALIVPNALAITGRTFQGKKMNFVFSLFGACAPIGASIGSAFAAVFGQLSFWPWAFWTLGIVCLAWAVVTYLILPADETTLWETKPRFDFAGTITGVIGLVLFNFAWNQAGVVGWTVPYTYVLLIVGVLFFSAFLYIEVHVAQSPLVPVKSLSKKCSFALAIVGCGWSSFGVWVYYTWQFLENVRGNSPLSAAAQQSVVAASGFVAAMSVGFLLHRVGVAVVMLMAMCAFLSGTLLIATTPVSQTYWAQTFVCFLIITFGMDLSFPSGTIILSQGMPREHQGIAGSLIATVVNYSISLSLGIAGTILRQTDDGGQNVLGSYRNAWYFAIGLEGFGIGIALWFLGLSMRGRAAS